MMAYKVLTSVVIAYLAEIYIHLGLPLTVSELASAYPELAKGFRSGLV